MITNGVVESFYVLENQLVGMVIVRNPKPMQPLTLDKRMKGFDTRGGFMSFMDS